MSSTSQESGGDEQWLHKGSALDVPRPEEDRLDPTTGVNSRNALLARLADLHRFSLTTGYSHVVCLLNLDGFRHVNQLYPVRAGDTLLRLFASSVIDRLPNGEFVARVGSDQFAILFRCIRLQAVIAWADRLLDFLNQAELDWESHRFPLTASIGISIVNGGLLSPEHALTESEIACRAAKELGGNCVQIFDPASARFEGCGRDADWSHRVRTALRLGKLSLFEQRIVTTYPQTRAVPCSEILLGLADSPNQLIAASKFLPSAQRAGLVTCIDRYVVRRTVDYLWHRERHDPGSDATFAVNLSGTSLSSADFRSFVIAEVQRLTFPSRMRFEVTETEAIQNFLDVSTFMRRTADLGCRFALDDFGSGLCSFKYLKRLPVDIIKIDGQFVRGCAINEIDRVIVESIHRLGRALGLKTIAEFVETQEVYETIRSIGVDYCQGHYFGVPQLLF
jgi:diguanylate cyclase (GGDEF)-like protein